MVKEAGMVGEGAMWSLLAVAGFRLTQLRLWSMTPWTCFSVEVTDWPFAVFMSASHWKWGVGGDLLGRWQCFDEGDALEEEATVGH